MAGYRQHHVMVRGVHELDLGAERFPQGGQRGHGLCGRIGAGGQDAPPLVEQGSEPGIGATLLGPGHRMRGNDRVVRQRFGQRARHRLLGRADVADHSMGGQGRRQLACGLAHRTHGYAQDDEVGIADRFGSSLAHRTDQPAFCGALAGCRVAVVTGGFDFRQPVAQRQTERPAEQAKANDGNVPEVHCAASAALAMAAAMASMSSASPMVIRRACGRPWPGR